MLFFVVWMINIQQVTKTVISFNVKLKITLSASFIKDCIG